MDKRYDKKILFFDVDDTLVDSKTGKVPESTIEALHNLQENGHKICISTGRPLFNKANPSIFFDVPWDGYVCFNGQGIYNKERVMFYNYAYSKDVVRRLIEKVNEQKYNMMLLEEKELLWLTNILNMQKRHVNIFIWICHHMKNIREMIFLEWLCVLRVDVIYLCLRI
ncbi:MAG: HAD hydrolase family protein [Eubacterium ventriosum]|uniref:HAD hydrolase family protein n=1 Tax=Eubacterium ventriosum TaxID=39496 RepID=UPI00300EB441